MKHTRTADDEADWMMSMHGGGSGALPACLNVVSHQFGVIQSRAQLMLTLSTLTLTITGFSGPQIAQSGMFARNAIIVGLAFVLLSTVLILMGSLRVQWGTQVTGATPRVVLVKVLHNRNRRTQLYRAELLMIVIGLGSYVSSVIAYLLAAE